MMILTFFTFALLLLSSNALSLDSSLHFSRHKHIAARQPLAKRSSRCKAPLPSSVPPKFAIPAPASHAVKPHASSSAPSHSPSPSPSSNKVGKVGIAWSNPATSLNLSNFITEKVSVIYDWSPVKPPEIFGLEYYAMLWGPAQESQFRDLVKRGYASGVMAFNEPNLAFQSNLSPQDAANIWMRSGVPLGQQGYSTMMTPATTNAPTGKLWMQAFLKACKTCSFRYMAAHYYGLNSEDMINYLSDLHTTFGMEIWVTEFACQSFVPGDPDPTAAQAFSFMSNITSWMDNTPFIIKYFAFGVAENLGNVSPVNGLMDSRGMPTALGRLYIGAEN